MASFIKIEALLVSYLGGLNLGTVSSSLPEDLLAKIPFIQVQRIGGTDDYISDTARVDIDVLASTLSGAASLSEQVRTAIRGLRHTAVDGFGLIDTAETIAAPIWVYYGDENIHRYTATYELVSRIVS